MQINEVFDATGVQPKQGGGAHPVGNKFPFRITNTEVKQNKENTGGMFNVEFTSEYGSIVNRYNLWNQNKVAVDIARQELSALCHATGIFQVDFKNEGKNLVGGQGMMDIGYQRGQEPSAEKPDGGYVELKKVYDRNGNEPGKANVTAQAQPQGGGWGGTAQVQPTTQQQPVSPPPPPAAPAVQGGWTQGNTPPNAASGAAPSNDPPWARK